MGRERCGISLPHLSPIIALCWRAADSSFLTLVRLLCNDTPSRHTPLLSDPDWPSSNFSELANKGCRRRNYWRAQARLVRSLLAHITLALCLPPRHFILSIS